MQDMDEVTMESFNPMILKVMLKICVVAKRRFIYLFLNGISIPILEIILKGKKMLYICDLKI